jgi:DNA-binding transcriptional ArsR family regulator
MFQGGKEGKMIEKLVTSKTRIKILNLFLSHIDDRYYLRELERMLDESLSPLRRQLVKLTNMGILIIEEEANLKYYRLNKNFEGLEELKEVVLGKKIIPLQSVTSNGNLETVSTPKQFRYDLAILSFVSIFVLVTAMFVVYANNKNIKQVTKLISGEPFQLRSAPTATYAVSPASNGEMASKKWKVIPGDIPVLSSGGTGEEKKSEEL